MVICVVATAVAAAETGVVMISVCWRPFTHNLVGLLTLRQTREIKPLLSRPMCHETL